MKKVFAFVFFFSAISVFAQKETFDIATYTSPKAWKKQSAETAIQFTNEDTAKGIYCMITLFKAVPATSKAKENFDMAWTSIVKEMVTVASPPEMQGSATENGWEAHSGYAAFEKDGNKGIVILVTSTGFDKMVNIVIFTNTDVYEKDITSFLESVDLIKSEASMPENKQQQNINIQTEQPPVLLATGFTFNTTNFDDGWTSVVKDDWVEVTKNNIKVLIHYPNKIADDYTPDLMEGLKNAWNILVAPKYSSAANMEFKPVSGWESVEFAEADMVEKITGKTVYVVLFKKNFSGGSGKYIEFILPDKKSFEKEFGTYASATSNYESGWNKMANMVTYNKFAVAASDLIGKWTSNFTGMTQYVNAITGANAGMNTHASNENFEFLSGNNYKWDLGVASGFVGNLKFQSVKSSGRFSMNGNWQLNFSDIEGKPKTYNVQFSCIKGARVLWIGDTAFGKKD